MSAAKFTNATQRMVFENAVDLLTGAGYNVQQAKLTQSYLRSEVLMSTSQSRLHLPVLVTDNQNGNAFNTERRLQLTDVFIVSAIGVYCGNPTSSTDAAWKLFSWGNPLVFTTSGAAAAIEGVFDNGFLSMIVDNDQMLPAWDLQQHHRIPQTQQATNVGYTSSGVNLADSFDFSADGLVPNEPNFILTGNSNIDFSLNTINAVAAVQASTTGRWVVRLKGVLAQNCSKIAQNQ